MSQICTKCRCLRADDEFRIHASGNRFRTCKKCENYMRRHKESRPKVVALPRARTERFDVAESKAFDRTRVQYLQSIRAPLDYHSPASVMIPYPESAFIEREEIYDS